MALPIIPFLVWTAPILVSVVWDILNNPEPTDNVRIIKEPPEPIADLPEPPQRPNTIKPPVRRIYPDPEVPTITDFEPPPELPPRILPPISTDTEFSPKSVVRDSLATKYYGCLFSKPYLPIELELCEQEDARTFYEELYRVLSERQEELAEEKSALKVAVAMLSLHNYSGVVPVVGLDMINAIGRYYDRNSKLIDSLPTTGMLPTRGIVRKPCVIPDEVVNYPDLDLELMNDCAIPLSMYNDMEGYKGDQLQIIWRNRDYQRSANEFIKHTVFLSPRPIGDYSEELFKSVLPQWRYSGLTRVDIELQGKIPEDRIAEGDNFDEAVHGACERWRRELPIFTPYITKDEVEIFIEQQYKIWIGQLCTEDVRVTRFVTKGYSSIDIKETWCYPYRAVYMGWDVTAKRWITKAHWYIYKQQPQGSPPS